MTFIGTAAAWNPSTELRSAPTPFTLPLQAEPIAKFRVGRQFRVVNQSGELSELELFERFVQDGELHVEIQNCQMSVYFVVASNDLRLANTEQTAPRNEEDLAPGPVAPSERHADPYRRAVDACQQAWRQYDAGIQEITEDGTTQKVILLSHELQTQRSLNTVLRSCRDQLEETWAHAHDESTLRQLVTIDFLLQEDERAWQTLEEAKPDTNELRSLLEYHYGKEFLECANVEPAWQRLNEAVRLDESNEYALVRLGRLSTLLDIPLPDAISAKVRSVVEKRKTEVPRTLPWLTILPVDESIRQMGRMIKLGVSVTLP